MTLMITAIDDVNKLTVLIMNMAVRGRYQPRQWLLTTDDLRRLVTASGDDRRRGDRNSSMVMHAFVTFH